LAHCLLCFPITVHHTSTVQHRVARWYIFKPEIQIWVNFGGSFNRRCWYILWPFGIFQDHIVYLMAIWYISRSYSKFCGHLVYFMVNLYIFPVLVCCTKKNLATLVQQHFTWKPIRDNSANKQVVSTPSANSTSADWVH
jgi:hypothetical protein